MPAPTIDAVVFDILGTLVDQPSGIRSAIDGVVPTADPATVETLSDMWRQYVSGEQRQVLDGHRPYAPSHVLDGEAAALVAERAGGLDPEAVSWLAATNQRLTPWPDTRAGLDRLAAHHVLIGLTNASTRTLARLDAHAGLRWHLALSAETVSTYKPSDAAYRLAADTIAAPPERILMVATHSWDLRGAQGVGLRTAYVPRPGGDPPSVGDRFDLYAHDLADLADRLTRS